MERIKRLFAWAKLPGWLSILLAAYTIIPDQVGRFQFWLGAAQAVKGHMSVIAAIVNSRYFSLGLLIFGLGYIFSIGETKRPVTHKAFQIVGWLLFAIFMLAVWSVRIAGYVAVHVSQQTQSEVDALSASNSRLANSLKSSNTEIESLRNQQGPWSLTDSEAKQLDAALSSITATYPFTIGCLIGNSQSQERCESLVEIFNRHGWKAARALDLGLRADITGMHFGVAPGTNDANVSPAAIAVHGVFGKAGMPIDFARDDNLKIGNFELIVGGRPITP